jgi:membrane protein DedA with SNARE-associated domain
MQAERSVTITPSSTRPGGQATAQESIPLEHFVATYGYAAIVVGTLLEGETILVIGGFLAHRGYLALPGVIGAAFAGTFAGDQLFFFIGRLAGMPVLERRPRWKNRADRVLRLLRERQSVVILGFRFLYGLRTVTPFLIGASGVRPLRFFALNALGGALWALCIGVLGYFLGHALEALLGEVKRFETAILFAIAATGATAWLLVRWRERR